MEIITQKRNDNWKIAPEGNILIKRELSHLLPSPGYVAGLVPCGPSLINPGGASFM